MKIAVVFLFFTGIALSAGTPNLLSGDSSVETESESMTGGPYSNSFPHSPKWTWDKTTAASGKNSIKLLEYCGIGINGVQLPAGDYTFSFIAKSSVDNLTGYITVNPAVGGWTTALKNRADSPVKLSTQWKRYSYTFKADGKTVYSPYYGIDSGGQAWFDCFMLNAGNKPLEWVETTPFAACFELSDNKNNVFPYDKDVRVKLNVLRYDSTLSPETLKISVTDHFGASVAEYSAKPAFDASGRFSFPFVISGGKSGWFKITAEMKGVPTMNHTFVMVRPPERLASGCEPFTALCGAENYPDAAEMIGVKWIGASFSWYNAENKKGVYDFSSWEKLREYKKRGFRIKLCFQTVCPPWLLTPELKKAQTDFKIGQGRVLAPFESFDTHWRAVIRAFLKQYGEFVDVFEIGGELDALIGLNPYYKHLDPDKTIGPYVAGRSMDSVREFVRVTAEEIRHFRPNAKITAVRPCDVDCRTKFIYSAEVFKTTGQWINCFGVDSYPRPRWIGPDKPPVGTEQDLKACYEDALSVMKKYCAGTEIFVSEYGYFIDYAEMLNPTYLRVQANRMARSYLMARALGMTSFYWYEAYSSGYEVGRYYMGIWHKGQPLSAVAALSAVARVVENVVKSTEIKVGENIGMVVFEKKDGRAFAALWSIHENDFPTVNIRAAGLEAFDIMGNPLELSVSDGCCRLRLTPEPVYLLRAEKTGDNYAALCSVVKGLELRQNIPAEISFRPAAGNLLHVYLRNTTSGTAQTGKIEYRSNGWKEHVAFSLAEGETGCFRLPLPETGKKLYGTIHFNGRNKPFEFEFTTPEFYLVARIASFRAEAPPDSWNGVKPIVLDRAENIMPIDHTAWSGPEDLSAKIYLAHDNEFLYLAVDAIDDKHFNRFKQDEIWKGDCLQIAFDPPANSVQSGNASDPNDRIMTFALTDKPVLNIRDSSLKQELLRKIQYKIVRSEKSRTTSYRICIPLKLLGADLKSNAVFGFNCILMDDDSNAGNDYWLYLKPGLAGGLNTEQFMQCLLQ